MENKRFSIFIRLTNIGIDKIKEMFSEYEPTINECLWMKIKDVNSAFYEIIFKENVDLSILKSLCINVGKISIIEEIDVFFTNKKNCLELLQDKGFKKYEETDYVDFEYGKRNVLIGLFKEDSYKLKVTRIEEKELINIPYVFLLINRVFEIVK